jgi:hypothetical protein
MSERFVGTVKLGRNPGMGRLNSAQESQRKFDQQNAPVPGVNPDYSIPLHPVPAPSGETSPRVVGKPNADYGGSSAPTKKAEADATKVTTTNPGGGNY